ncbi:MAG: DUF3467 domain-containing protein [Patescibacteria group bacterium]|nr:DUF3467 domain-containing protein [Patescibacteria group bacterium]
MEQQKQLQIKAKDQDLKGFYSNLAQIIHTKDEFVLDFFMVSPPQGILGSRIIMSPGHIKRFVKALEENLSKYEDKFGKIEETEDPNVNPSDQNTIGFKT